MAGRLVPPPHILGHSCLLIIRSSLIFSDGVSNDSTRQSRATAWRHCIKCIVPFLTIPASCSIRLHIGVTWRRNNSLKTTTIALLKLFDSSFTMILFAFLDHFLCLFAIPSRFLVLDGTKKGRPWHIDNQHRQKSQMFWYVVHIHVPNIKTLPISRFSFEHIGEER